MFSDLNFYKIVKVKRKVNVNVMIRILQFFILTKNLIKMFKATTLPTAKKSPAITQHLIYHLKGMKRRILVFWEMQVNQNLKPFLKNLISTINILNSFYVSVGLETKAAVRRCFTKWMFLNCKIHKKAPVVEFLFLMKLHYPCLLFVNLFKKRLWHSCLPMNFAKLLRKPFLQNTTACI